MSDLFSGLKRWCQNKWQSHMYEQVGYESSLSSSECLLSLCLQNSGFLISEARASFKHLLRYECRKDFQHSERFSLTMNKLIFLKCKNMNVCVYSVWIKQYYLEFLLHIICQDKADKKGGRWSLKLNWASYKLTVQSDILWGHYFEGLLVWTDVKVIVSRRTKRDADFVGML